MNELELINHFEKYIWKLCTKIKTTPAVGIDDLYQEGVIVLLTLNKEMPELVNKSIEEFHAAFVTRLKNRLFDIARMENHRQCDSFELVNEEHTNKNESDYSIKETYEPVEELPFDNRLSRISGRVGKTPNYVLNVDLEFGVQQLSKNLSAVAKKILNISTGGDISIESKWENFIENSNYARKPKQYTPQFVSDSIKVTGKEYYEAVEEIKEALLV